MIIPNDTNYLSPVYLFAEHISDEHICCSNFVNSKVWSDKKN